MTEETNQENLTGNISEVEVNSEPAAVSEPPPDSDPVSIPAPVSDSVPEVSPQPSVQPDTLPEVKSETQPEIQLELIPLPQSQVETPLSQSAEEPPSEPQPSPRQLSSQTSSRMKELWGKFREKVIERKSKKLEKIMALVTKKRRITNDDVQKLLHVSDATATRYLKELVRQGRLKQSGTTSGSVYGPFDSVQGKPN